MATQIPNSYRPTEAEPYMCDAQLAYFRQKLLNWKEELGRESMAVREHLRSDDREVGDDGDSSVRLEAQNIELTTQERHRHLIRQIDSALRRISDGSYGYCEITGEPIGLRRLEARPIASLSVHAQEMQEQIGRVTRASSIF